MADTLALNDNQRVLIGIAFTILLTLNVSLAGLAASNQIVVPQFVYFTLAIAAVVVYAIKDKLGIETATTARIAKETAPTLQQNRAIPPQESKT